MPDSSQGSQAKLSLAAAGTAVGSYTEAYEFISENLVKAGTILDTAGIRGTRSHASERTQAGTYTVQGTIKLHASPAMLDTLLPRILGAAESSDAFALAETLPQFDVLIDRVAKRFVYAGCKVDKATFRGQAGGLIELDLEVIGKTETVTDTAFPAITAPTDPPYAFQQGVLTLVSSARDFMDFELVIENRLQARFSNSAAATDIMPADREITLRCRTPFTSGEADLYAQALLGTAGSLAFTNGGYSTTFAFGKLQAPDRSPVVAGKSEIPLLLELVARMTSTTRELLVTHDSTA